MMAMADKVILQRGYYQNLLDQPLPTLHKFTLNEMIDGWRVLQSFALVVSMKLVLLYLTMRMNCHGLHLRRNSHDLRRRLHPEFFVPP